MSELRQLSKVQKNELLGVLQQANLEPTEFTWSTDTNKDYGYDFGVLSHRPTGGYFKFDPSADGFFCSWWPDLEQSRPYELAKTWPQARNNPFQRWVLAIAQEHTSPDLWATVADQRAVFVGEVEESDDHARFQPHELRLIAERMAEIGRYLVKTHSLDAEQQRRVHAQLAYLTEAAERSTKTDWWRLFRDVMLTIAVERALSSPQAKAFLVFAANQVRDLFPLLNLITQ